jgi:polyisoprenoid-binding protein YceI
MSTMAPESTSTIPAGTWNIDPVHSSIGFSARHMVVNTYRGEFEEFSGRLVSDDSGARLDGVAPVSSVTTRDPNLTGHLASPDFFDAARHPELRFVSSRIERSGDSLTVDGDITLKGVTKPVQLVGEITGPVDDPYGGTRLGVELAGKIDRRDFDITWNAPLPAGGLALGYEVKLNLSVEFVKEA